MGCAAVSRDAETRDRYGGQTGADSVDYVFARNQGGAENWGLVKQLTASDGALGDSFGPWVALDGDTVVAGAPGKNSNTGAAYVFELQFVPATLKKAFGSSPIGTGATTTLTFTVTNGSGNPGAISASSIPCRAPAGGVTF